MPAPKLSRYPSTVRLSPPASRAFGVRLARENAERARLGLPPLSFAQAVSFAMTRVAASMEPIMVQGAACSFGSESDP